MGGRISDVARKVGVSEATVSRVLNGRPGVSDATRQQILTALDVLGYERPTRLRGSRARFVGLVLPELKNPIYPAFAEALGGVLVQNGLTPILVTESAGGMSEPEQIALLLDQQVTGIIFVGGNYAMTGATHKHYETLTQRALPVVLINAALDELPFPRVVCDDAVAVEQAFTHLYSLGHRRIAYVLGPEDHLPSLRKLEAARVLTAQCGLDFDNALVKHAGFSLESGQLAGREIIAAGATAVICASDPLALGVLRAAKRARVEVPASLSVVGYDDSALMTCVDPPLSTVRQPIDAMAREAVERLLSQADGKPTARGELHFEPELVVRGSTGPAPQ